MIVNVAPYGFRGIQQVAYILRNADMTLTTDQPFVASGYLPDPSVQMRVAAIFAVWKSGAFGVACAGGVYSGAAKSGLVWGAAAHSYANLTGTGKYSQLTAGANVATDLITGVPILSLTAGNTGALVADFFLFANLMPVA